MTQKWLKQRLNEPISNVNSFVQDLWWIFKREVFLFCFVLFKSGWNRDLMSQFLMWIHSFRICGESLKGKFCFVLFCFVLFLFFVCFWFVLFLFWFVSFSFLFYLVLFCFSFGYESDLFGHNKLPFSTLIWYKFIV